MKNILIALIAIILIHVFAAGVGVAALELTGRLNMDRVHAVVDIFKPTLEEEKLLAEKKAEEDARQAAIDKEKQRMAEVADGPSTVKDRLEQDQTHRDLVLAKVQRLQREMKDMNRNLEFAKVQLAKEKKELELEKTAFEKSKSDMENQRLNADFERVVETYSNLKPQLAKQAFMALITQGKQDQVVDYLAAMQLRKSAAILNQFKANNEVPVAVQLLELLRQRGITPDGQQTAGNTPLASR